MKKSLICGALVLTALFAAPIWGQEKKPRWKTWSPKVRQAKVLPAVELSPLEQNYSDCDRIMVRYAVMTARDEGVCTVELSLFDIDTGKRRTRTFKAALPRGLSSGWAAWGGEPPYTSEPPAKDATQNIALDDDENALTLDDTTPAVEAEIPNGYYIPQIVVKRANGEIVCERKYSDDEVNLMRARGEIGRKLNRVVGEAAACGMAEWLAKIDAAHAKARQAGADTARPDVMRNALGVAVRLNKQWLASRRYDIPVGNLTYCNRRIPEILAEYERIAADPKSALPAGYPTMPKTRLGIGDGCFTADGKPIFLLGQCMFALWPDLDIMESLHVNLVHISEDINTLFPNGESEEPEGELVIADGKPKYGLVKFLDECLARGMKVDLGLTARPPEWFFKKHPAARLKGGSMAGFLPWDPEHPETHDWVRKYFAAIMPKIANHPALNSIWLANEPGIFNWGEIMTGLFRAELERKYGKIKNLNAAWGAKPSYRSFDEITLPLKAEQAGSGVAEIWKFDLDRLTRFFAFMRDEVRKYDKTVNICYKLCNFQMGWYCPAYNVDTESVADLGTILGMDSGTYPFAKPYYDWLMCLSPGKPVVNLEFKGGGARTKLDAWKAAFFGLAGMDTWCWHGNPAFAPNMAWLETLFEYPRATADIQRNYDVIRAFHKMPRSPFCFVYPDVVFPRSHEYFKVHTPVAMGVKHCGYIADYATERRIADGRLDQYSYDYLVLPAADYLKGETTQKIGAWLKKGGKALVFGEKPTHDPLGHVRDLGWLSGDVTYLPAPKDEHEAKVMFERDILPNLPQRPLIISDSDKLYVEYHTRPLDGVPDTFVTWVLSERHHDACQVKAETSLPVLEAVDLITGEKVDLSAIRLAPWDVKLIRWKGSHERR